MGDSAKLTIRRQLSGEISMEAYHIERFGSADGIVLRATDDPRSPRPEREPDAGAGEFAQ